MVSHYSVSHVHSISVLLSYLTTVWTYTSPLRESERELMQIMKTGSYEMEEENKITLNVEEMINRMRRYRIDIS